jgi:hypothetical protein
VHASVLSARGVAAALLLGVVARVHAAEPSWGKAAENRVYAQQLVNDLMAEDSSLLSVALHATRVGAKSPVIVAHTQDLIGKEDSPEDVAMVTAEQTVIGPEMVEHTTQIISRMVVHAPLQDRAGKTIGMAVFSFKRHPGLEKIAALVRAEGMLRELSERIPSAIALFEPSSKL